MARRRWMLKAPRPPPKRKARGIQKAIARRLRDEKEKLAQWKLALEAEEASQRKDAPPLLASAAGGEGTVEVVAVLPAIKVEAAAATPDAEGAANAMDIVTTTTAAPAEGGAEPPAATASSATASSSSASTDSTPPSANAQPAGPTPAAATTGENGEGSEGGTGGGVGDEADDGKNGASSASAMAAAANIAARIQDEEERRTKIDELERKLDVLGEQKHKLFLLLKQVLFVDEKKRKKLAEEERNRIEEQRRAEETRRVMQMKALRDSGKEPANEGSAQSSRPQYGESHGYMYPPQREYSRVGMSPGGGGGSLSSSAGNSGYHSSGSSGLGSRGSYPPHLSMSHPPSAPRSPMSPSHSQHSPTHSPLHSSSSRDSRKRRAPPLSSYNSPSIGGKLPSDRGPPPSPPTSGGGGPMSQHPAHVPPRRHGSGGGPPAGMFPFSSHFPQVPPVHMPPHMALPHGIPLGMLPAQLALQSQLGIPPFPPHMMRPGPGLLPTPPPGGYRNRGGGSGGSGGGGSSGGGGGGGGGSSRPSGPPPRVRGSDRRGW